MEEKNILPDELNDDIKEHGLDLIMNVASNCIGFDIKGVTPDVTEEDILRDKVESLVELIKSRLNEDEVLNEVYNWNTGKYGYSIDEKPLEIDANKPYTLTEEDKQILKEHGIVFGDNSIICGISDRDDDILIIRTSDSSWMHLAGREWHYNLKTKKWSLHRMN